MAHRKSSEIKLLPLKWSLFSVKNVACFSIALFTATLETYTVYAYIPLEQYTCTKQSWMEDYCKQDKEVNVISTEDWMDSSVDPPCFGQSMILINHTSLETVLTYTVISLMYYRDKYLVFVAYNKWLMLFGKRQKSYFLFNCVPSLKQKNLSVCLALSENFAWLLPLPFFPHTFSANEWLPF